MFIGPFIGIKGGLHQEKPEKHEDEGSGLGVIVRNERGILG